MFVFAPQSIMQCIKCLIISLNKIIFRNSLVEFQLEFYYLTDMNSFEYLPSDERRHCIVIGH